MNLRPCPRTPRSGGALIFALTAVLVVSILAACFLELATSISRRLGCSSDTVQALNIAEAGLAEAYTGLAVARTGNVGSEEAPAFFAGGLFWVEATEQASGLVELECTAMYGTGRAVLGIVCESFERSVGSLGFFTLDDLRLNPDSRLDSYDSALGNYDVQSGTPINNIGLLGSNGDVSIAGGDLVFGDVTNGPTGKTSVASGAVVTGTTSARPTPETLPPIEVPDIALKPALTYSGATPMIVPPGEVGYASVKVAKNAKMVLKGPLTMVVGGFSLALGSQLAFDTTDGPVQVYVTDSLDLATGSTVSTSSQVTTDSLFLISAPAGKAITLGSKSKFYGFIYAPTASAHVSSQFEVFGGLVCKELQLAAQGRLHFDRSLAPGLNDQLPKLYSWRVVDLPTNLSAKRMDPFHVLDVDPSTLSSPANAHQDQFLDITYVDQNGAQVTYTGSEKAFDWSDVKQILFGSRDGTAFYAPVDDNGVPLGATDPNVDLVNSGLSSKQLRDALLAAAPVSDAALIAAALRNPPMQTSDLMNVFQAHPSLSSDVLMAAISSPALDSSSLRNLLVNNSPLLPSVLAAVLARIPPLSVSDLTNLLSKQ